MHPTELLIFAIYLLLVAPAVVLPLIWAAVLDGRYHASYIRRRALRHVRLSSVRVATKSHVQPLRSPA